jgi:F-type H+-transporting ATPase subunit a
MIPSVLQHLVESLFIFINKVVKQQLGEPGMVYFPLLFVLFNVILINNLLGLIPNGVALTSHLILILLMSFSLITSIFIVGLRKHNIQFLKIFIPTCPFLLLLILIPIEIFSYGIRLFSLAIRLAANIVAGHTLVYIITGFIFSISTVRFWFVFILI